jgi:hypothetical protein
VRFDARREPFAFLAIAENEREGFEPFPGALSAINDTSCYLGRSHFVADPYFAGTLDEFRIHATAFSAADVAFSEASGPNPGFL